LCVCVCVGGGVLCVCVCVRACVCDLKKANCGDNYFSATSKPIKICFFLSGTLFAWHVLCSCSCKEARREQASKHWTVEVQAERVRQLNSKRERKREREKERERKRNRVTKSRELKAFSLTVCTDTSSICSVVIY